jgi:hypothetical protein
MKSKKKIERFYLDRFFDLLGETPERIQCEEAPDFVVDFRQTKIGIEITEFHSNIKGEKGWPRRLVEEAWEYLRKEIMKEVEKYEELKNTKGFLFFKNLELPPDSLYKEFLGELVQLSIEMIKSGLREINPGLNYPLLNKYLKKFCLEKVDFYISWEWNHIVSFIGLSELELINAVEPKFDKATDYRKTHIDALWLIIVSGVRLSQTMPIPLKNKLDSFSQLDSLLKASMYEKVFLFQYQVGVIYQWPKWIKIGKGQLYPTVEVEGMI